LGQVASGLTDARFARLSPDGTKGESRDVVATPASEGFSGASVSPDGRWLAYAADMTGQVEIWVRPYARTGPPVRVSPNGGLEPVWARHGRELFYLEGRKLEPSAEPFTVVLNWIAEIERRLRAQ
jgi:Tol biopolymer transport system component